MDGVLNVRTETVHKREGGESAVATRCGATNHMEEEPLRPVSVNQATTDGEASRCGRCFDDAGGY